ncbi:MAG: histidine--tRNA ligase [Candidatus Bathyarchaeia archaeon]
MSSNEFTLPRGMKDIEPDEMNRRLWLYDRIRQVVQRYGFQLVEPTTIETLKTLEAKSGPAIRNEIYWFKDKGDRSLGLRFDLTVGLTRIVSNRSDLPEPIKYAAIGGNWRYDEPQYGRYRYFTQWDVEIFGSPSPLADAEVISIGAEILRNVGLKDFIIRISNRKLIEAYLNQLGIRQGKKLEQSLRIIDKIRKENHVQLERELATIKISKQKISEIFTFVSLNGPPKTCLSKLKAIEIKDEKAKIAIIELEVLADALDAFGLTSSCIYDLSIVRGIGYYDGIVFEAFDKAGDVGAIFGGGRYDQLCKVYGKRDLPSTGAAGGIERLMISLEREHLFPTPQPIAKVFVATVKTDLKEHAIKLATRLRENEIAAIVDLKDRNLGKQIDYVNSTKIPYLIVLGQQELETQVVKIKNMATRTETEASFDDLVSKIKSLD